MPVAIDLLINHPDDSIRPRILHSNQEGPPSLVPRHQHLQVPRCCRSRSIVLRARTSFVTRPSRNCRAMYVPPDSPWRSEILYEARVYMPSSKLYARRCFVLLIVCTAGETVSAFWWTPAICQAHIVSVNRVSLARRSNRAKSSSPPGCSGGGRECRATSEWEIDRFITNLIECQRNSKSILFSE